MPRRTEDDPGAVGQAGGGMRGEVVASEVRFGLDDDARGLAVDQDFAEEIARDFDGRAVVKFAAQDRAEAHRTPLYNKAVMRLFVGLDLPAELVRNLEGLLEELRPTAPIQWSPPANLHITTKFIGEWPEERLPELIAALAAIPGRPPIPVHIRRVGFFPNPHAPRVFWCGIEAPGLAELAAETDRATASLGIESEKRAFSPHLTLARIKERPELQPLREKIVALPSLDFGAFEARSFFLYRSKPGPKGSVYTKLSEFPLANR
jgi:RNA 2',3'-cyclic 3'-phosphodiesterase